MYGLTNKGLYILFLYISIFVSTLSSCSHYIQEYEAYPPPDPDRIFKETPNLATQPSHETGGQTIYQKLEKSEEEKARSIKENSTVPINYQERSAGNINIKTTRREADEILNLHSTDKNGLSIYEEGLKIKWGGKHIPDYIVLSSGYKGSMDFGIWAGEGNQKQRRIGQSFKDLFGSNVQDVNLLMRVREVTKNTENFIVFLYKHLENTKRENCLTTQRCKLEFRDRYIVFSLPKMTLIFTKDEQFLLKEIVIFDNSNNDSCLKNPFDILNLEFFCGYKSRGEQAEELTVKLGDNYEEAMKKLGTSAEQPFSHNNDFLSQYIYNERTYYEHYLSQTKDNQDSIDNYHETVINWKRNNLEEESQSISGYLSSVSIRTNPMPFLLGRSFIKVRLTDSDDTVHIETSSPALQLIETIEA